MTGTKFKDAFLSPGAFLYDLMPAKILINPENQIVADISRSISADSILDLGSGTGYLTMELAKTMPASQVLGIDSSMQMVRYAKTKAQDIKNVQFIVADAANLPYENNSVDFIISTASLHHWNDPAAVFKECHRVLKTGKQAWIYDLCYDALKSNPDKAKKDLGFFNYHLTAVTTLFHCYSQNYFQTAIKHLLDQTAFKNNFQMQPIDIWIKTTLQKP